MTPRQAAERWATAWRDGWEARDPAPILALYAPDAVHVTQPFRDPARGRDAIRAYVEQAFDAEHDPHVWMARPVVDGDRAAIAWWASLREAGADTTLAGISLVRFDAEGLVTEQWDAWNELGERRDPAPSAASPFGSRDT